jgi:hypothetical protein
MAGEATCRVRNVDAPDGTEIPVPAGGLGLADGMVEIRDDAEVQISRSDSGFYVVVSNTDPSNNEAEDLFGELSVETAITKLEHLATEAFSEAPEMIFKGAGLLAGVLVSVFTTSKLTREIFIRAKLSDDTPITYCILT